MTALEMSQISSSKTATQKSETEVVKPNNLHSLSSRRRRLLLYNKVISSIFNFEDLIGPTLLIGEGTEVYTKDLLKNKKYVMLYFSAQWCPPCRKFTPLLGEAYNAHKAYIKENNSNNNNNNNGTDDENNNDDEEYYDIEVIFVSLDSIQTQFNEYRSQMPFYSIPFANLWMLNLKDKLSNKYGIRSIPTLIILNGDDGSVITKNGKGEYGNYFKGDYVVPSSCCIS